ncbi:hypothetical protein CHLRE_17g735876v5 [Chlamydomonas reinhardtii]|uniref:Uncharacterized protein n=1 Tax=Chlamydomonas reinhardtii TaxID=3055 RepID=A0A2K3CRD9_CHLRE|nr:uncharacterized protein CHLRE_17g735876v5 [Chlamydomonas reinhardtii]PNW70845.1 hypothetical protein CHLRE_17g735876v5 [Chlamydomonas reinhardtii]
MVGLVLGLSTFTILPIVSQSEIVGTHPTSLLRKLTSCAPTAARPGHPREPQLRRPGREAVHDYWPATRS